MEENGSYSWVPPKAPKERKTPDFRRFGRTALVIALFLVVNLISDLFTSLKSIFALY